MRIAAGAEYQSDLRYLVPKRTILENIKKIQPESYPPAQWQDFLRYTGITEEELFRTIS